MKTKKSKEKTNETSLIQEISLDKLDDLEVGTSGGKYDCACVCMGDDWEQFRGYHRSGRSLETSLMEQWPEGGAEVKWVFEGLGKGYSSVSVVDGVVYTTGMIGETGYLFAIDDKGNEKWRKAYGAEWTGAYPGCRTTPTASSSSTFRC